VSTRLERVWDKKYQKWIEVGYLDDPPSVKARRTKRKPFKVDWVKLPNHWIEQLERSHRPAATYKLAHRILREAFKQQYRGCEVVLSTAVTAMPRTTRHNAAKEMVALGLIRTKQEGRGAVIVTELLFGGDKPKRARRGKNGK
jgi:hypothetical protein